MRRACWLVLILAAGCGPVQRVGPQVDGRSVVTTGQFVRDVGQVIDIAGRPLEAVATPDGRTMIVKEIGSVLTIDIASWKVKDRKPLPGGASHHGLAIAPDGRRVLVSNAKSAVHVFTIGDDASLALERTIAMPQVKGIGEAFPTGIAVRPGAQEAWVCLSMTNSVVAVDWAAGTVGDPIPVGIAPYDVEVAPDGRLLVACQGGVPARDGQATAASAKTAVEVDDQGLLKGSVISFVDPVSRRVNYVGVDLQPTEIAIAPGGKLAVVACANADSVVWLDLAARKVTAKTVVKPDARLPFGSMPNALSFSRDGRRLWVALAGNNAVAAIEGTGSSARVTGLIPTNWYPTGVLAVGGDLLVCNYKGKGSRSSPRAAAAGRNSHDRSGSLQRVAVPNAKDLAKYSAWVRQDSLVPQTLAAMERAARSTGIKPVPIPARLGEPSVFKHVIYVIKENRTYDNIFGDIEGSEADPKLCIFPEEVTPNHHAIAKEFVLLDNYYCNGVLSADGHSWATEGNVTPYLERSFGGFTRSYTFGNDPLTYSSSGFIWDRVLAAGLSFRNYGEMDEASLPVGMSGKELWEKYTKGEGVTFGQMIEIDNLRRYSCRDFPGWNMNIPDVLRMDRFMKEFREFERNGDLPNFTIIYLPQDHTGGAVSPRSNVADNDLAVGRLVEAVSKSRFWKEKVLFINEDDPQAGFDHIDGHRSICLVVCPYTKRGVVNSDFFNQTSVLHTILRIFGLPPLNQRDSSSPLMTSCFTEKPDFKPYTLRANRVPLDEFPPAKETLTGEARRWAEIRDSIDTTRREVQTEEEMDLLNRYLWHMQRGFQARYPAEWTGAHGRGLKKRGLKFDSSPEPDDD